MNLAFSRTKVNKAVILAGGQSARLSPLTKYKPAYMFPILNRPLIEYTIYFLKGIEVKDIVIAVSRGSNVVEDISYLRRNNCDQVNIQYIADDKPRGTAGILRDLREFIGDESFLVINSNTFIDDVDLNDLLTFHTAKDSIVTIGAKKAKRFSTEGIYITPEGIVNGFHIVHSSRERRSSLKPVGIYIFNPLALKFIEEKGYFGIKEQLIPALKNASLPVYIHEVKGYCRAINSIGDYCKIHREVLLDGHTTSSNKDYTEISDGIWVGENVTISPQAYLLGPAIIGSNCTIEKNAQIIGPVAIGKRCKIGEGTLVRESILWEDSVIEEKSSVEYCVAGQGLKIHTGDSFRNKVVVDNLKLGEINLTPLKQELRMAVGTTATKMYSFKYIAFIGLKRLVDISFAFLGLLILSPLVLLISIAIRLDSSGPVIFRQKRCGKGGKDFEMLKFRTMVKDAESLQQKLASQKDVDGPMFKLVNDPRVTRVGKFLRKTSLDELPQFINVLKGEMSLVGPRPLAMNEMKFSPSWRDIRLKVNPGITGLWQVKGRSETPFHDWIRYDVFYVKNQSLWLDIKILVKTILVVLRKIGAH